MDLYPFLKPLLFGLDPETAHALTFRLLGLGNGALLGPIRPLKSAINANPVELAGLRFRNPIGLAAGMDKNAKLLNVWEKLGLGHIEIGTVTPLPQPGNPKPRLFRLVQDQALINRMGFNNDGAVAVAKRLQNRPNCSKLIVGGNIGKNKATAEEDAYKDYLACLDTLHDLVDYFTVNISSPNTVGLRNLQARDPLKKLLSEVQNRNQAKARPRPLFVKIAPDLTLEDLDDIVHVATEVGMAGIVATNTTISRAGLKTEGATLTIIGNGGLSGAPLKVRSLDMALELKKRMPAGMVLIGSGGIMSGEDARARFQAGADLVQVYTGLVYRGPGIVPELVAAYSKSH